MGRSGHQETEKCGKSWKCQFSIIVLLRCLFCVNVDVLLCSCTLVAIVIFCGQGSSEVHVAVLRSGVCDKISWESLFQTDVLFMFYGCGSGYTLGELSNTGITPVFR